MRASKADNSKVHMCNYCSNEYPTCNPELIEFGDGIGNDNVIVCSSYMTIKQLNNFPVTGAPELGIFKRRE